jgi:adenylate cyclase
MSDAWGAAFFEGEILGSNKRIPLSEVCRVGRIEGNEVVIPDETVSRNHALLLRVPSGLYFLHDVGSSNGTFVNGVRVTTPVPLRDGDRVTLGSCEFRFQQPKPIRQASGDGTEPGPPLATRRVMLQKHISVLVADIRNFTGLAQRLDPGALSQIVGSFFRESGLLLQKSGAWGQNYAGDAVMAVWVHAGNPGPGDVVNVCRVACGMAGIAAGLQERFGLDETIRIGGGINSGLASLGNISGVGNADHTALGETVNRAFRLESMTREINFDLAIGESTYRIVEPVTEIAAVFSPCTLTLKGYSQPVTAYATRFSSLEGPLAGIRATQGQDQTKA